MQIKHIINAIEAYAPPALQESWDNTGLQVGDAQAECTGVLICLDVTHTVLEEALARGCNLIVSHHPLLFKGLKRITASTETGRIVLDAVRAGISVYSSHTSLDSARGGVSHAIAESLGAKVVRVLHPTADRLLNLTVYAERGRTADITAALADAGHMNAIVGDEQKVTTAMAEDSDGIPAIDIRHKALAAIRLSVEPSRRAEMARILDGLGDDVTYAFSPSLEVDATVGLGVVAEFEKPMPAARFIEKVKSACGTPVVRCNAMPEGDECIRRIAICGGAGGEFAGEAAAAGVDAYLTADVRYHDFSEWAGRLFIVDAGHFETENCTKKLFMHIITKKIANFAVYISETEKNPINYL